jgi:2-dehydro-3-deoxy-L-rhamnonate dehydrogenase (NAD+)
MPDGRRGDAVNRIDLNGRVAVVAGGAGGIGLATADRLLASGATVTVWEIGDAALARARTGRDQLRVAQVDMLDADAVKAATASVTLELGRLDILVNCTGKGARRCAVADYDVAEWRRSLDINLTATFIACKFAVQAMRAQDYGRIVNLSSTSGKDGNAFDSPYAVSKAAVRGFTKVLAKELAATSIRRGPAAQQVRHRAGRGGRRRQRPDLRLTKRGSRTCSDRAPTPRRR